MNTITSLCILVLQALAEDILDRDKRAEWRACPDLNIDNGKVNYHKKPRRATFRCNKKFTQYGEINCQEDGTWDGKPPVCIKTGCPKISITHIENLNAAKVYNGSLLQFTCENNYQLIGDKEIYCDGRKWSAFPPTCLAPSKLPECHFEYDLCGWTQDKDDERDWDMTFGPTKTEHTGPMHDHTYMDKKTGHYLYFESSSPARERDQARLRSPMYTKDFSQSCFEFWYHIYGPDDEGHVGSLEVYVVGQSEMLKNKQPMFYKEGNQGNKWHKGEFYIDTMAEDFQIVIVAKKKLSYISDIAIDDLRLDDCNAAAVTTSTNANDTVDTSPSSPTTRTSTSTIATTSLNATTTRTFSTTTLTTSASTTTAPFQLTTSLALTKSSLQYTMQQNETSISDKPTIYYTDSKVNQTVRFNITLHSETMVSTQVALETTSPRTSTISQSTQFSQQSKSSQSSKHSQSSLPSQPSQSNQDILNHNGSLPASTNAATSERLTSIISINITDTLSGVTTDMTTTATFTNSTEFIAESVPTALLQNKTVAKDDTSHQQMTDRISITSKMPSSPFLANTSIANTSSHSRTQMSAQLTTTNATLSSNLSLISTSLRTSEIVNSVTTHFLHSLTDIKSSLNVSATQLKPLAKDLTTYANFSGETTSFDIKTSSVTERTSHFESSTVTEAIIDKSTSLLYSSVSLTNNANFQDETTKTDSNTLNVTETAELNATTIKSVNTENKSSAWYTSDSSTDVPFTADQTTVIKLATSIVEVSVQRSRHAEEDLFRPLMIGLGVGVVAGLFIITVIAWVCFRKKQLYTTKDEIKPTENSVSSQSLNEMPYCQDENKSAL